MEEEDGEGRREKCDNHLPTSIYYLLQVKVLLLVLLQQNGGAWMERRRL